MTQEELIFVSFQNAQLTSDGKGAKKKPHVVRRLNPVEEPIVDVESVLHDGLQMSTNDFESHVQSIDSFLALNQFEHSLLYSEIAPGNYWPIMAEYYRRKLSEVTRENQQVKNIVEHRKTIIFSGLIPPFSFMKSLMNSIKTMSSYVLSLIIANI